MKFTLQRTRTINSVLGHSVEFVKGEPVHVPPELYAEVMAAGAVPDEEVPEPTAGSAQQEPTDPGAREAALFEAFEVLALGGKREDFTAGGQPHPKALADLLGWKVGSKERDVAWVKFRTQTPE